MRSDGAGRSRFSAAGHRLRSHRATPPRNSSSPAAPANATTAVASADATDGTVESASTFHAVRTTQAAQQTASAPSATARRTSAERRRSSLRIRSASTRKCAPRSSGSSGRGSGSGSARGGRLSERVAGAALPSVRSSGRGFTSPVPGIRADLNWMGKFHRWGAGLADGLPERGRVREGGVSLAAPAAALASEWQWGPLGRLDPAGRSRELAVAVLRASARPRPDRIPSVGATPRLHDLRFACWIACSVLDARSTSPRRSG